MWKKELGIDPEIESLHRKRKNHDDSDSHREQEKPAKDGDGGNEKMVNWYSSSRAYWATQEPTVNGMLGGLGSLSELDLETSEAFIRQVNLDCEYRNKPRWTLDKNDENTHALDVGAGIGRITRGLLMKLFHKVDMLESDPRYVATGREECEKEGVLDQLGEQFNIGMEQFERQPKKYDLVWIQWCIIYCTDQDLINLLIECSHSLKKHGLIILKDNVILRGGFVVDRTDSSITRNDQHMKDIFKAAGLNVIQEQVQRDFPKELYPVKMYCLEVDHPH